MSDEINWQSAFSDDSLDGALDKAKQAKSKFDDAAGKVSERLGADDDTVETERPAAEHTQVDEASILLASSSPTPGTAGCSADEIPQYAVVEVAGIPSDDPDGGLNFRELPDPSSEVLGTFDNGTSFDALGAMAIAEECSKRADGSVWWKVFGHGISGWANSRYFTDDPFPIE